MPSKITKRTLQGLKNAGTVDFWKKEYGHLQVRIFSREWHFWWRPNGCGYTDHKELAGIYTLEEALNHSHHCGPEKKIEYEFLEAFYAKPRQ